MWKILLCMALFLSASVSANEFFDRDGCYQMYRPGSMFPVFCLMGTNEEGVNGSGVRMVIFHTNTDQIIWCERSVESGGYGDQWEGLFEEKSGLRSLKMNGQSKGSVFIDEVKAEKVLELNYLKISQKDTFELLRAIEKSECFR